MSGHSKWATIKRKKGKADQERGKIFSRLIKEITIAARQGGSHESNVRLRSAIDTAKAANMPAANIERAVQRGTGELEGVHYEEITYEGYGPGGVAILVDVATDNRNRTAGEFRNLFTKFGGNMAEAGAVGWMFESKGVIVVERGSRSEDEVLEAALEAGADDVSFDPSGTAEILTQVHGFDAVRKALIDRGFAVVTAELSKIPTNTIELDERAAASVLRLFEALEGHDDAQKVYANFQIADEVMARLVS
jgi:YebC/PmpR family DNA-binding regulatory protein